MLKTCPLPGFEVKINVPRSPDTPIVETLPEVVGNEVEVNLDIDEPPISVSIDGKDYFLDVEGSKASGTFTWNNATKSIVIRFADPPGVGTPIIVRRDRYLPTTYISPPYPDIFSVVPMEGNFQWTRSFESHPSGSLEFRTYAKYKSQVIKGFGRGTRFVVFDVGLQVNSLSWREVQASNEPMRMLYVQVSLGGWHEEATNIQVSMLGSSFLDNLAISTNNNEIDYDPECLSQVSEAFRKRVLLSKTKKPRYTTVSRLAGKARTKFTYEPPDYSAYARQQSSSLSFAARLKCLNRNPRLQRRLRPYEIEIPSDTPRSQSVNWLDEAKSRARLYGHWIKLSEPHVVRAKRFHGGRRHFLGNEKMFTEITGSNSGLRSWPTLPQNPGYPNPLSTSVFPITPLPPPTPIKKKEDDWQYGWTTFYEPAKRLTGRFSEQPPCEQEIEKQNNPDFQKPKWKKRERKKSELVQGADDPTIPVQPNGSIRTLSVNFDASGETKTQEKVETLDGLPYRTTVITYGYAAYSYDIANRETGRIIGAAPKSVWRKISEKTTNYIYENQTGYFLAAVTYGWEIHRFVQENDGSFELLVLTGEEGTQYNKYKYKQIPYRKKETYYLEPFRAYYKDIEYPDKIIYWQCSPFGKKYPSAILDPNYIDPYFVREKVIEESCISRLLREDAVLENYNRSEGVPPPNPYYIAGKEGKFVETTMIAPSKNTKIDGFVGAKGKSFTGRAFDIYQEDSQDSYAVYDTEFRAQESGFQLSLKQTTSSRNQGRPPIHTRLPALNEREEPPNDEDGEKDKEVEQVEYDYWLWTSLDPRYPTTYPPITPTSRNLDGGSLSYGNATTLTEAVTAAQTELDINNLSGFQESFGVDFNIGIHEGDFIGYVANGESRSRRVMNVSCQIEIQGGLEGKIFLTSQNGMQLSLSLDRVTPMRYLKRKRPKAKIDDPKKRNYVVRTSFVPMFHPLYEVVDEFVNRYNDK